MNVYEKLVTIQNELKAPKSQYNSFGKYNYRSCEDILEALKPICLQHKALTFISDEIVNVEGRQYVKSTVTFVDIEKGDKLEVSALAREEETKKGMDGSQVTGASSSYARKYALNGMFCIDDTKDSDATNTHGKEKKQTDSFISEQQQKLLFAKAKGKDQNRIKDILTHYGFKDSKSITKDKFNLILSDIEAI